MDTKEINKELESLGVPGIKEEDVCPERTTYLSVLEQSIPKLNALYENKPFTEDHAKEAKKIEASLKYLRNVYILNFHKYFASVYPHLLFEKTNDKVYWDYNEQTGLYEELSFPEVRSMVIALLISEHLSEPTTETQAKNILNRFRANHVGISIEDFITDDEWLHVKNGWLNRSTLELEPHTPERRSLHKMAVDYDPEATCPLYDKYLDEDTRMPKDQTRVLDQYSGYILTNSIKQQQMLILEGRPGCGKSTLPEIWMEILGEQATTHKLSHLSNGGERFIGQSLSYKTLCFFDEANPRTSDINETFMGFITDKRIRIERKAIQGENYVRNTLKLVLSLNEMPDHMPPGMDRRYRHIVFTRSFSDEQIEDRDFGAKVVANELPGVLNRMLRGLHDWEKMGGLTLINGEEDRKTEYSLASDDISAFISDHFDVANDNEVRYTYQQMRGAFISEYPKKYNEQLSIHAFNKKIKAIRLAKFSRITTGRTKETRGYKGLILKSGHSFASNDNQRMIVVGQYEPDNF